MDGPTEMNHKVRVEIASRNLNLTPVSSDGLPVCSSPWAAASLEGHRRDGGPCPPDGANYEGYRQGNGQDSHIGPDQRFAPAQPLDALVEQRDCDGSATAESGHRGGHSDVAAPANTEDTGPLVRIIFATVNRVVTGSVIRDVLNGR
jgi:hypothetical protein